MLIILNNYLKKYAYNTLFFLLFLFNIIIKEI